MTEEQLVALEGKMVHALNTAIKPAVDSAVNGHIRDMSAKLDGHIIEHRDDVQEVKAFMAETRPLLEAYRGGKVLGEGVKWLGGVGIAYLAIKGLWK